LPEQAPIATAKPSNNITLLNFFIAIVLINV
jgi:hypothetical protein